MENKQIKKILQYPVSSVVSELLKGINLKENEKLSIEIVDIRGNTEDYASKKLGVTKRSIQNYRKRAYEKLKIAFTYNEEVLELLERLE